MMPWWWWLSLGQMDEEWRTRELERRRRDGKDKANVSARGEDGWSGSLPCSMEVILRVLVAITIAIFVLGTLLPLTHDVWANRCLSSLGECAATPTEAP